MDIIQEGPLGAKPHVRHPDRTGNRGMCLEVCSIACLFPASKGLFERCGSIVRRVLVMDSGGSGLSSVSLRKSIPNVIKISCRCDALSCSPQVSTEEIPLACVATVVTAAIVTKKREEEDLSPESLKG